MSSEAITRNDLKAILEGLGLSPSAYIVETGTSGIWTYRKWSDGTAECWGYHSNGSTAISTASGGMYMSASTINIAFPSGLFVSAPTVDASTEINKTAPHGFFMTSTGATGVNGRFWCATSGTNANNYVHIQAKGKWK